MRDCACVCVCVLVSLPMLTASGLSIQAVDLCLTITHLLRQGLRWHHKQKRLFRTFGLWHSLCLRLGSLHLEVASWNEGDWVAKSRLRAQPSFSSMFSLFWFKSSTHISLCLAGSMHLPLIRRWRLSTRSALRHRASSHLPAPSAKL